MPRRKGRQEQLWDHLAYASLVILYANDGQMSLGDLRRAVDKKEGGRITESDRARQPDGRLLWENRTELASIKFVKAGFLKKGNGVWRLTDAGESILSQKLDEEAVIQKGKDAYRKWRRGREEETESRKRASVALLHNGDDTAGEVAEESLSDDTAQDIEQHESVAIDAITQYIRNGMNWEQFQDLCAALLRGMGYHVRSVAGRGPDGGIDILAYTDPLGARARVKVQVKHYQEGNNISLSEVQRLAGVLAGGDIGVFITSSGYTHGCRDFARDSDKHLELIDLPHFIKLWREHYNNLSEEDKELLPLKMVYFLGRKRAADE